MEEKKSYEIHNKNNDGYIQMESGIYGIPTLHMAKSKLASMRNDSVFGWMHKNSVIIKTITTFEVIEF